MKIVQGKYPPISHASLSLGIKYSNELIRISKLLLSKQTKHRPNTKDILSIPSAQRYMEEFNLDLPFDVPKYQVMTSSPATTSNNNGIMNSKNMTNNISNSMRQSISKPSQRGANTSSSPSINNYPTNLLNVKKGKSVLNLQFRSIYTNIENLSAK